MKKCILIFAVAISLATLFSAPAFAEKFTFADTTKYWVFDDPSVFASSRSQNRKDVNGMPNILGGSIDVEKHNVSAIDLYYTPAGKRVDGYRPGRRNSTSQRMWHEQLDFGDLFIDAGLGNDDWDYIVSDGSVYDVTGLSAGFESDIYVKTPDAWTGSGRPRYNHPVYAKDELLADARLVGSVTYSGWVTELDRDNPYGVRAAHASWIFDLDAELQLWGPIMIGLATNCANDVLLEEVVLPTPEPSTFVLLLAGLVGTIGFTVRKKRTSIES